MQSFAEIRGFPETAVLVQSPLLRSMALLAALLASLVFSAEGADARLKSEWKFGGSLAGKLMSLPGASAWLGDGADFDSSVVPGILPELLPIAAQPVGGSLGQLFGRRGLVGGFAAGFLGAGLLGVLFGHGIYGELNGIVSVIGLVFQLALIAMLGRLIWSWWRVDRASSYADLSPRQLADAYGRAHHEALPAINSPANADTSFGDAGESFTGTAAAHVIAGRKDSAAAVQLRRRIISEFWRRRDDAALTLVGPALVSWRLRHCQTGI